MMIEVENSCENRVEMQRYANIRIKKLVVIEIDIES